ncbi:uncharacterized protein BO95DRAFT_75237 [Aspergillus brunneoviolaceus CBS 621.78]|uniref:Uncharacterized protein n=1 Tax=Aspergillus brunneoviolaceus CBS 621.78 TaxID=1450534 RepID=A0ACD1GP91_9EURO|nr:hypothetical protein BO95DRAFT_75237 [Aspergillus brunneoviolaceus CBS 621.78]RAH51057.1 hypothetical protein BO95DRAFT_75237 [Aspergillus brunneoviolaceus CBS 621.78]
MEDPFSQYIQITEQDRRHRAPPPPSPLPTSPKKQTLTASAASTPRSSPSRSAPQTPNMSLTPLLWAFAYTLTGPHTKRAAAKGKTKPVS